MKNRGSSVCIKIIRYCKDGFGQGECSLEGRTPFLVDVPFSKPGDEVQVELFKKIKGVFFGRPKEWLRFSENRQTPSCRHFGDCGGCRWQHIPYEEQLSMKQAMVYRLLEPFLQKDSKLFPITPCSHPWEYRNKMELTFSSDKAGNHYLGLISLGTRGHVFQMKECHLMRSWIAEAVTAVSRWWEESGLLAYHSGSDKGSLRTLTFREGIRTGDRMVILTVSGNPAFALNKTMMNRFVAAVRKGVEPYSSEMKLSVFLRIQQIAKGRPTQFYEMLLYGPDHLREILYIETDPGESHALHFRVSPSAFFQPNPIQAEQLYSKAIQLTQASPQSVVYDLYCGTGTLGICMAKKAKEVIGIELSPESSLDAKENIKLNQLCNVSICRGDVGQVLPQLLQQRRLRPEVVMIDPPRAGLEEKALHHLLSIGAPKLTYISCNPSTQARDVAQLVKSGYRIHAVQPVDQFPHTVHVENIVVLSK